MSQGLLQIFEILPETKEIFLLAIDSELSDYEDAVIETTALKNSIDYIITRNVDDFRNSQIDAITPMVFLSLPEISSHFSD